MEDEVTFKLIHRLPRVITLATIKLGVLILDSSNYDNHNPEDSPIVCTDICCSGY